mmetsp:Transcript_2248/g.3105  ORF Transcript_2248/g.3105 Transcript_2248/m.3105 type:complete len:356 (+) Transcript_2248:56-1123(+)
MPKLFCFVFYFYGVLILILLCHANRTNRRFSCHQNKSKLYCFPDIWFIGASKCGTTTMAYYFSKNPAMIPLQGSGAGESDLFDSNKGIVKSISDIERGFELQHFQNKSVPSVFYYRPDNLYYPEAPKRISKVLGDNAKRVKFLVMLREPVSRTFSSWSFKHSGKLDHRSWEQAMAEDIKTFGAWNNCLKRAEVKGIKSAYEIYCHPNKLNKRPTKQHHLNKSVYFYQFLHWFSYFPSENFHVIFMEDLIQDIKRVHDETLKFFTVDKLEKHISTKEITKLFHKVKNTTKKKDETMLTKRMKERLEALFLQYNRQLANLFGLKYSKDLNSWQTTKVSSSLSPSSNITWLTSGLPHS